MAHTRKVFKGEQSFAEVEQLFADAAIETAIVTRAEDRKLAAEIAANNGLTNEQAIKAARTTRGNDALDDMLRASGFVGR